MTMKILSVVGLLALALSITPRFLPASLSQNDDLNQNSDQNYNANQIHNLLVDFPGFQHHPTSIGFVPQKANVGKPLEGWFHRAVRFMTAQVRVNSGDARRP
jgi:hypothetical protein